MIALVTLRINLKDPTSNFRINITKILQTIKKVFNLSFEIILLKWDQRFKNQPVSSVKMSATRG
jgi:hypothetical protein